MPSHRVKTRVSYFPIAFLLLSALVAACSGGGSKSATGADPQPPENPVEEVAAATAAPLPVRLAPLTGEVISEEQFLAIEARKPLAVMIDNIYTATPQAGLDQADVVIEALVEGGVTRYMAIFHSRTPAVIEPVRSARTPFLYWASEYDALYVHVGSAELDGPADAGQQIYDWGIHDMDLGTRPFDNAYIRDPARRAPHNVLITAEDMWAIATGNGLQAQGFPASWSFTVPEGLALGDPAPGFTVRFGTMSPRFSARWDWDPSSMRYYRSQFGEPQFDAASGSHLAFPNVIVQYAEAYVADRNGHVLIDVVGEGRAQVFTGGQVIEGTWWKADRHSRTEFFGPDGKPVPLLAGPTWIEVVPSSGGAFLD